MRRAALTLTLAIVLLAWPGVTALAADPTVKVTSEPSDLFLPGKVFIKPGHAVHWKNDGTGSHNVCFGHTTNDCIGGAPVTHTPSSATWEASRTFNSGGKFSYFCSEHSDGFVGMVGTVVVDGKPPVITELAAKPAKFCTDQVPNCTKRGTTVEFKLSEAAKVFGDVRRDKAGTTFVQKFAVQKNAGKQTVKYSGKGLKPGPYILRLRAKDRAGNAATPKTVKFTVKATP